MRKHKHSHNPKQESSGNVTPIESKQLHVKSPEFSTGDLGKIQEILFGQQLRANADQFSSLNNHAEEQLARLSNQCQDQFTALSAKIDSSIDSLKETLLTRDKEYQTRLTEIACNHLSLKSDLTEKLKQSSESSDQLQQQLNSQIEQSSVAFSNSLNTTREELAEMVETSIGELQAQKLDRTALSNLLGTVAAQLTNGQQPLDGTSGDNHQKIAPAPDGSVDSE